MNKQARRIIDAVQAAGWTYKETTKGYMLRHPDGVHQVLIHKTSSDHRAIQNIRKDLRRAGFDLPAA